MQTGRVNSLIPLVAVGSFGVALISWHLSTAPLKPAGVNDLGLPTSSTVDLSFFCAAFILNRAK